MEKSFKIIARLNFSLSQNGNQSLNYSHSKSNRDVFLVHNGQNLQEYAFHQQSHTLLFLFLSRETGGEGRCKCSTIEF